MATVSENQCDASNHILVLFIDKLPFDKAETECQGQGGHLVGIRTEDQNSRALDLLNQAKDLDDTFRRVSWIGLKDNSNPQQNQQGETTRFTYTDGNDDDAFYIKPGTFPWAGDDLPDDSNSNEDCVKISSRRRSEGWDDSNCNDVNSYICELPCSTDVPTESPTFLTEVPTQSPSLFLTEAPTNSPSNFLTEAPTIQLLQPQVTQSPTKSPNFQNIQENGSNIVTFMVLGILGGAMILSIVIGLVFLRKRGVNRRDFLNEPGKLVPIQPIKYTIEEDPVASTAASNSTYQTANTFDVPIGTLQHQNQFQELSQRYGNTSI